MHKITSLGVAILELWKFKKTLKDDRVASIGLLLYVVLGTRIHKQTLYILQIPLHVQFTVWLLDYYLSRNQ